MEAHFITPLRNCVINIYVTKDKNGNDVWDGKRWMTITWIVVRLEDGTLLRIPPGFITNFGSIPKTLRSFLNRMGKSLRAFVVHDWTYSTNCGMSLKQRKCDSLLYTLSRQDREGYFSAQSINKGLMFGGWTCYKKSKPKIEPVSESVIKAIANDNRYRIEPYCS
jgi:hypothetical protein